MLVTGCGRPQATPRTAVAPPAVAGTCAAGPLPASEGPSRQAFFHEVLFSRKSARTHLYDDYTEGSYHASKLDLARGLPAEGERCGVRLRGLLLFGPAGPLWSFHVLAFLDEGDQVRVNSLLMPHARITGKGTVLVARDTAEALVRHVSTSSLVRAGLPTWPATATDEIENDFSYDLLLVRYTEGAPQYWHASLPMLAADEAQANQVEQLVAPVNRLLAQSTRTYEPRPSPGGSAHSSSQHPGDRRDGVPVARGDRDPEEPVERAQVGDDLHVAPVHAEDEPVVAREDPHQPPPSGG